MRSLGDVFATDLTGDRTIFLRDPTLIQGFFKRDGKEFSMGPVRDFYNVNLFNNSLAGLKIDKKLEPIHARAYPTLLMSNESLQERGPGRPALRDAMLELIQDMKGGWQKVPLWRTICELVYYPSAVALLGRHPDKDFRQRTLQTIDHFWNWDDIFPLLAAGPRTECSQRPARPSRSSSPTSTTLRSSVHPS
mmetsp:Transcript_55454/g.135856  ORF Transcript_55454/g.135856 Transcript_55454/m.135856 type:complete len:192 (+) Transcript_55454:364-939(+)